MAVYQVCRYPECSDIPSSSPNWPPILTPRAYSFFLLSLLLVAACTLLRATMDTAAACGPDCSAPTLRPPCANPAPTCDVEALNSIRCQEAEHKHAPARQ